MCRGREKLLLAMFVIVLISFTVSAQPPAFQVFNFDEGYEIEIPKQSHLKLNENFTFYFHVFNISTGLPLLNDSVSCEFNLHNSSSVVIATDNDLEFMVDTTAFIMPIDINNFTVLGTYAYVTHCNSTTLGGVISVAFEVTPTGRGLDISESILYITILFFTFLIFAFFLFLGIKLPYGNELSFDEKSIKNVTKSKYLKILSIWFASGFFMWFLQTLSLISISYTTVTTLTNFITNVVMYSGRLAYAFTVFILIWLFVAVWKDIVWNKQIREFGKGFIGGNPT